MILDHSFPPRKSPLLHISVLTCWASCVFAFAPRLFLLFQGNGFLKSGVEIVIVVSFLSLLAVFWLYGVFYLLHFVAAFFERRLPVVDPPHMGIWPRVAVLYTTFHDFQEGAVRSCLAQKYPGEFKVFILDDSTRREWRDRIDVFAKDYEANQLQVIRRPVTNRTGYKAGNINHALREEITDFPYFAVFDADSVAPPDFLHRIMPYFELAPDIAFLQGGHIPRPLENQPTSFAQDLSGWTDAVWNLIWLPKNRFGFAFFLGHGGVISYQKWRELGKGFPEVASEDIAISVEFQLLGYRGWHVANVCSEEEFPADYRSFRKQQKRYIQGVCEFLHKDLGRYLRSDQPRWFEKLDLLLTCTSLFLPCAMMTFMVLFCVVMPWRFGLWHPNDVDIFDDGTLQFPLLLQRYFHEIWTVPFLVTMLGCSFGPVLGALSTIPHQSWHGVRRGLNLVFLSAVPFMSILVMGIMAIVSYLRSRHVVFGVTGDRSSSGEESTVAICEELFVIFCGVGCILTSNWTLGGPCVATLLGLALRWDTTDSFWDPSARWMKWTRWTLYVPFLCIVFGIARLCQLTIERHLTQAILE